MLRSIILLLFCAISLESVYANCDFNTAEYLEQLAIPAEVKKIVITIPNSRKFTTNSLRILLSNDRYIKKKYKDKFEARIEVQYEFGKCDYTATVRQTGDLSDHMQFIGSAPAPSLNVSMHEGNILSAVKFKLLIPETRNGPNEILGSLILRDLGILAPETFSVDVSINGAETVYLWQERAAKEMLERNYRREGPIFEGDETGFWSIGFKSRRHLGGRLENDNWAKKGDTSFEISLGAFIRLQNAFLNFAYDLDNRYAYFDPNNDAKDSIFTDYAFYMFSLGGQHGLSAHNRKFYFDPISEAFEPIYYDGDFNFPENFNQYLTEQREEIEKDLNNYFSHVDDTAWQDIIDRVHAIEIADLIDEFTVRSAMDADKAAEFVTSRLDRFRIAISVLHERYLNKTKLASDNQNFNPSKMELETSFVAAARKNKSRSRFARLRNFTDGGFEIECVGEPACVRSRVSQTDVIRLMNKNRFERVHTVIMDGTLESDENEKVQSTITPLGLIEHSGSSTVEYTKGEPAELRLQQSKPEDWFLLANMDLSKVKISLFGKKQKMFEDSEIGQRFNNRGLTGCLTLYKTRLTDVEISTIDGACEDSLNLLASEGSISSINVTNAMADAVDMDFSNLRIAELWVKNAKNDCLDVSSGIYNFENITALNCGDKAFSIGEASKVNIVGRLMVENAPILLSAKDSSLVAASSVFGTDVQVCLDAHNKKQEFNGALLKVDLLQCEGPVHNDTASKIHVIRADG